MLHLHVSYRLGLRCCEIQGRPVGAIGLVLRPVRLRTRMLSSGAQGGFHSESMITSIMIRSVVVLPSLALSLGKPLDAQVPGAFFCCLGPRRVVVEGRCRVHRASRVACCHARLCGGGRGVAARVAAEPPRGQPHHGWGLKRRPAEARQCRPRVGGVPDAAILGRADIRPRAQETVGNGSCGREVQCVCVWRLASQRAHWQTWQSTLYANSRGVRLLYVVQSAFRIGGHIHGRQADFCHRARSGRDRPCLAESGSNVTDTGPTPVEVGTIRAMCAQIWETDPDRRIWPGIVWAGYLSISTDPMRDRLNLARDRSTSANHCTESARTFQESTQLGPGSAKLDSAWPGIDRQVRPI